MMRIRSSVAVAAAVAAAVERLGVDGGGHAYLILNGENAILRLKNAAVKETRQM